MIDEIIAFGCSNTHGAEAQATDDRNINKSLNPNFAYPKYLADIMHCKWSNYAEPGICNQLITKNIIYHIQQLPKERYSNVLVLIGWTGDNRLTVIKQGVVGYYHDRINKSKKVNDFIHNIDLCHTVRRASYQLNLTTDPDQRIYKDFANDVCLYYFQSPSHIKTNLYTKYAAHKFLEEKQIKFLAFPTMFYLNDSDYFTLMNNNYIQRFDHDGNIVFAPRDMFHKLPDATHLSAKGHQEFAVYLHSELLKRKII